MITRMYATVLFDREITDKHYISPGDVTLVDKNGNELSFGFEYSYKNIDPLDKRVLYINESRLYLDCFPEAKDLEKYLKILDKITELYIYTGEEDEDPEINPVKILSLVLYDENGNTHYINTEQYKHALDWVKTN